MAITKKDVDKLSEIFATKDDLKAFATKDDLRAFATKVDLERFVTKLEFKEEMGKITTSLDWLVGKTETILNELKIINSQMGRYDRKLEDHETRITTLEAKV